MDPVDPPLTICVHPGARPVLFGARGARVERAIGYDGRWLERHAPDDALAPDERNDDEEGDWDDASD